MKLTRELLRTVHEKTGGACWYCGQYLHPLSDWQIDHQVPRCQGGGDEDENLVPACRRCNGQKGGRTVQQYRAALQVQLEHLITGARELVHEHWGYSPADVANELSEILFAAAKVVVISPPIFWGEHMNDEEPPSAFSTTEVAAIQ